ncbi:PIN domain-containing protein [[Kitasatospora] papulosa]|uniref:PIN-like domain-containing protein n=1 Tax=[Kitasatospora] papulosa TaxID=1464011 RepID=UPI002E12766B|nr:PIN domain-containing protein [[Kitasatospora] papulosa]
MNPEDVNSTGEASERDLISLNDGFEHYLSASLSDYERVVKSGLVVLDTNAILNLYRYTDEARKELFGVLRSLQDRLWIPNQVATEFWRNRESAVSDLDYFGDELISELEETRHQMERSLRTWANRVALQGGLLNDILNTLDSAFKPVLEKVQEIAGERSDGKSRNTFEDPVLLELQEVLVRKVGAAMGQSEYENAVTEGLRRVEAKIPPGYKDKKKDDGHAAGDYLVWAQTIKEAKFRHCEVLLITGDVKEDWWRKESGEIRGPRLELAKEFYAAVGFRVYMLRPPRFLEMAREILQISVTDETIDDASRVELSSHKLRERIDTAATVLASLWSELLSYVKAKTRLPLNVEAIDMADDSPGLIALFHSDSLVYLGSSKSATRRLRQLHRKLSGRINISPDEVSFAIAPLGVEQINDRMLPQSMIMEERPAWNMNGFGNHDPGRLRSFLPLAADHFDMLYPIDLSIVLSRLADSRTVGELVRVMRDEVPYPVESRGAYLRAIENGEIDFPALDGTVENSLRVLANALPQDWQITVTVGRVVIEPVLREVPHALLVLRSGSLFDY